jgi:Omp85 superfamily domain
VVGTGRVEKPRTVLVFCSALTALLGGWPLLATSQAASAGTPHAGGDAAPQPETEAETSFWERFQDPVDGRFDVTASGDGGSGLIPLIIPFNDPAVGAGAVAGIVYFHPDDDEATAPPSNAPPDTSFAGAARSDNDSWVFAGGHSRGFNHDRIRYLGAAGAASVNLDFYGIGKTPILNDNPLGFNLDGSMLIQQLQFQLGQSRAAAGFRFTYINATTTFDDIPPELVQGIGGTKDAGLGVFTEWDTRDTTFTPSSGVSLLARLSMFSEALGGDQDYAKFTLASRAYWPFRNERLIFGLRADYTFVGGDAPFYALPFLSLRGVPAFRYLGNHTVTVEVEPRWKIDDRWSVLGFAGAGRAAKDASALEEAEGAYNYGVGFRYLIARRLGLAAGVDLAEGPEESILMLTFGSAWGF